jgi:hypothetical protein
MGKALADPVLCCIRVSKGRIGDAAQWAEACLQIPLPWSDLVPVGEVEQHGHEPLLLIKHQKTLFLEAGVHSNRLKGEAHAASSSTR